MSLLTATSVIDELGGTTATAKLTRRKPQHVTNWRTSGRLPPDTFLVMRQALAERGKEAPAALWGITDPSIEAAE
jgi:hypothetical protein